MRSRRMTHVAATILFAVVLLGMGGDRPRSQTERTSPPGPGRPRSLGHVEHDRRTDATFSIAVDARGNPVTSVAVRDFLFEKVVDASGNATIRLSQGKDTVLIAVSQGGYSVGRGKRSAHFDPRDPQESDLDAVRSVLTGSPAVRTFRRLSSSLENQGQDDEGPLVLSALVDGALVEMLDGDPGATERIARRVTRKRRAAIRAVAAGAPGVFRDCLGLYEFSLVDAYDTYWSCLQTADNNNWPLNWFSRTLCEWEFVIRSQQYIYQLVACMAF